MALAATVRQIRVALERAGVATPLALRFMLRWVLQRQIAALRLPLENLAELPGFFTPETALPRPEARAFDAAELAACWHDPTTLGWAYQFWNDLDREAIDKRIGPRGRVRLDELASKTQLFTERYMVDWLVQNSAGQLIDEQPLAPYRIAADDLGLRALDSLRIFDPACGTGHFLVGAFDFLLSAHRERARAAGHQLDAAKAAHHIVEHNLHGLDLDPIAVQIAAAALWLQVKGVAPDHPCPPLRLAATALSTDREMSDDVRVALSELRWRGTLVRAQSFSEEVRTYLRTHAEPDDLGIVTRPAAAPVGARILELLGEGRYDVVLSNPPYLATAKIELDADRVTEAFDGMPDLFAAFTRRSLELCREDGLVAFVALSNWMFLSSFRPVRELLLRGRIVLLADLGKGAFRHASKLIQTAMVVAQPRSSPASTSRGARVGSRDEIVAEQPELIAESLRDPSNFARFDPNVFVHVEGAPFLFWIDASFLQRYAALPKIEDVAKGAGGIATSNNERFVRAVWEVAPAIAKRALQGRSTTHLPYLKGAEGREWIEPCRSLLRSVDQLRLARPGQKIEVATELGVAYTTIGQRFGARMHTAHSVRDVSGASFFATACTPAELLCALNKRPIRELACALNPTINFQLGDVRRLPFDREPEAERIVATLRDEFERAERGNELSPAFVDPTVASAWPAAGRWAQRQVDRPRGQALEPFAAPRSAPDAHARLSHAIGLAFGRFGATGLLDTPPASSIEAFVADQAGLSGPALAPLRAIWTELQRLEDHSDLGSWLRHGFFAAHRRRYEGRPIYLPLSSRRRSFVVWVTLHRFRPGLLEDICSSQLIPRLATADDTRAELEELIATIRQVDRCGPAPADDDAATREVDARFELALEDGALLNAAALWPLLEPQWKDPRRIWRDLGRPSGKRDYDWSKVAARYFPSRVRAKCIDDPSLALAHGESGLAPDRHPRILAP